MIYIRFMFGRLNPKISAEDHMPSTGWIGPLKRIGGVYTHSLRLTDMNDQQYFVKYHDDMLKIEDMYYSDWVASTPELTSALVDIVAVHPSSFNLSRNPM